MNVWGGLARFYLLSCVLGVLLNSLGILSWGVPVVNSEMLAVVESGPPAITEAFFGSDGLLLRGENFGVGSAQVWLEYNLGKTSGTVQAEMMPVANDQAGENSVADRCELLVKVPVVGAGLEIKPVFSAVVLKVNAGVARFSLSDPGPESESAEVVATSQVLNASSKPIVETEIVASKRTEVTAEGMEAISVPAGFDFSTTRKIQITRQLLTSQGVPLATIAFDVYTDEPANGGAKLTTVCTDKEGNYTVVLTIPCTQARLYLDVKAIGCATGQWLELDTLLSEGQAVEVAGGWNLLSIPSGILNPTRRIVFGEEDTAAFGWNGKDYYQVTDELLSDVQGYWVWQANSGLRQLGEGAEKAESVLVQSPVLAAGWNLVSPPDGLDGKSVKEIFGEGFCGAVWDWNGATYVEASQSKLSALKGYWLYCPQTASGVATRGASTLPANMSCMGTFNSLGVPDYLAADREVVDAELLENLNQWFPEQTILNLYASYLDCTSITDIQLKEEADVSICFVHEGANLTNALGYYTYSLDAPPSSPAEVENLKIVFPNFSYGNTSSVGGLATGDRVDLGHFSAGTGIGFFQVVQGFDPDYRTLASGRYTLYSNSAWNSESDAVLQRHTVLLSDLTRELLLLGFEDLKRDNYDCDNDFNDAIAGLRVTPFSAVDLSHVVPAGGALDTDEDGIPNYLEDFPEDPKRAYNNYSPGEDRFGTLAFEDLWPNKGDYDFNDLVVRYRFNYVTNADSQVVDVKGTFRFVAVGGAYHDGFAFELPVPASLVESISGSRLFGTGISLNAKGAEDGQDNAVIVVTDDVVELMGVEPDIYHFFNTVWGSYYAEPVEVEVSATLNEPQEIGVIGLPPYNPFAIANGVRGMEIHLPGKTPTTLADSAHFGTGDDASNPASGVCYTSGTGLPWALHIPNEWSYPFEQVDITKAYLKFQSWAESGGAAYEDWYEDEPEYRDSGCIYRRQTGSTR
jgi:LruC domain-containing protein